MIAPLVALAFALLLPQEAPSPADQQPPAATGTQPATPRRSPCRSPDPSGNYSIGCGVVAPKVLNHPDPEFSQEARKKKLGGHVLVSVVVDTDGNPTNIRIERSLATKVDPKLRGAALSLDAKAVEAVGKYKFSPAMKNGNPVPVRIFIDVNFQIF
jgi:TonB family protein